MKSFLRKKSGGVIRRREICEKPIRLPKLFLISIKKLGMKREVKRKKSFTFKRICGIIKERKRPID